MSNYMNKPKELVVISGKGGTGKTSLVAGFASVAENKIIVDCDVDAADLHLILSPQIEKVTQFYSGKTAEIDLSICVKCNKCLEICRFEAISHEFIIDPILCEGCGACYYQCPFGAIDFKSVKSGEWFESSTRFGKFIHAKLGIAEENSGKLVSQIKDHARSLAQSNQNDFIIVDGSPGIGCPVIASISGADLVLIVIEATISGMHDAQRVLELTEHFGIKAITCISKYDLNLEISQKIEDFCRDKGVRLVGKLSYNDVFTRAMMKSLSVLEYSSDCQSSKEIKNIWNKVIESL